MGKTLFFNIPAQGHVNPMLAVIAELVRRDEQVICINTEDFRSQIESAGGQFRPYPSTPQLVQLFESAAGGTIASNALALAQVAEQLLPSVLALLRAEQPDYVIHDSLAGWAKQAAALLGIPAIASLTTLALRMDALPPISASVAMDMIGQVLPVLPAYWATARRTRRTIGVKSYGLVGVLMNTNALNIVFTSAQFQPNAAKLGDSFRFIGPSITERSTPRDSQLDSLFDSLFDPLVRHPIIYISLGTINNNNPDFYRRCFAAFADHPGQFVLSAGKRTDLQSLGAIPANFIVRNFVPQLDVLKRADLFITHGGMNSVHESLYYGVPLIVVPQQHEQAIVAQQVAKNGAGVVLGSKPPFGQVSAEALRSAVDQLIGNNQNATNTRFREAAARLGESFRAAGGPVRAAEEILLFAARAR